MSVKIEFKGPYDEVFDLVEEIREAGASVAWQPPDRDRGGFVYDVTVNFIASGAVTVIAAVVRSFLARHRQASALIQEGPDEDPEVDTSSDDDDER